MRGNNNPLYIPLYESPATVLKNSKDVNFTPSSISSVAQHAADNKLHLRASLRKSSFISVKNTTFRNNKCQMAMFLFPNHRMEHGQLCVPMLN